MSIEYFEHKAEDLEQAAKVWAALAELAEHNAACLTEPHASHFERQAREAWATAEERADHAAQTRRVVEAMRAHPSSQCATPITEPCECDTGSHTPPLRALPEPEASPLGDVRNRPVPCRSLNHRAPRPETWNWSGRCDACLAAAPTTWRERRRGMSLAKKEQLDDAFDAIDAHMDDAS